MSNMIEDKHHLMLLTMMKSENSSNKYKTFHSEELTKKKTIQKIAGLLEFNVFLYSNRLLL